MFTQTARYCLSLKSERLQIDFMSFKTHHTYINCSLLITLLIKLEVYRNDMLLYGVWWNGRVLSSIAYNDHGSPAVVVCMHIYCEIKFYIHQDIKLLYKGSFK